jgi:hypothetical protein
MKIVWVQRYPSDNPRAVVLPDAEADEYVRQKQDDYRYTTGQVWTERHRGI